MASITASGPSALGGQHRLTQAQRERDRPYRGVLAHVRRRQRIAGRRDEAADRTAAVRRTSAVWRTVPRVDHLEVAVLRPVASRRRLHGAVVRVGGQAEASPILPVGWARPSPAASITSVPSTADWTQPLQVVLEPFCAVIVPTTGSSRASDSSRSART